MSAVFDLHDNEALFEREKNRFLASLEALTDEVPKPNRQQDRRSFDHEAAEHRVAEFVDNPYSFSNTADTDPDLSGNREWGRAIAGRMVGSQLGAETVADALVESQEALDEIMATGVKASEAWQALGA